MNLSSLRAIPLAVIMTLPLAGCFSSSTTSTAGVTGTVADGYIEGATVCLDRNRNFACDTDEPSAVTDANGQYSLDITQAEADTYPIIVEVPQGATDQDRGTILQPFTMATLPGQNSFISPITTLIAAEIEHQKVPQDVALSNIQNTLGVNSTTELFADFIVQNNTTLKQAAPAIADLIAEARSTQSGTVDTAVEIAILDRTLDLLPMIVDLVSNNKTPEDIKKLLSTAVSIDQTYIDKMKDQLALAAETQSSTWDDLTGKTWYQIDEENPSQLIAYNLSRNGDAGTLQIAFCNRTDTNCLSDPFNVSQQSFSMNITFTGSKVTLPNNRGEYLSGNTFQVTAQTALEAKRSIESELSNLLSSLSLGTSAPALSDGDILARIGGITPASTLPAFSQTAYDPDEYDPSDSGTYNDLITRAQNGINAKRVYTDAAGTRYVTWLSSDKATINVCLEATANSQQCTQDTSGNDQIIMQRDSRYQTGTWQGGQNYVAMFDIKHYLQTKAERIQVVTDEGNSSYGEKFYYLKDAAKTLIWFNKSVADKIAALQ